MYDVPREWLSIPSDDKEFDIKLTYVDSNTRSKYVDGRPFSTVVGNASSVSEFGTIYSTSIYFSGENLKDSYPEDIRTYSLIRGNFMPFIAAGELEDKKIEDSMISNICRKELNNEMDTLKNDQSPFYAISNREYIDNSRHETRCYCYRCILY